MDYNLSVEKGVKKLSFYKNNFLGFLISSILAGVIIGLCFLGADYFLISPCFKEFMFPLVFCLGLITTTLCGFDLFTSNCLYVTSAIYKRKIDFGKGIIFLLLNFIFNIVGVFIITFLIFLKTNIRDSYNSVLYILSNTKNSFYLFKHLFIGGIICNFIICLSSFICLNLKETTPKLIVIFLSILLIYHTQAQHCIAKMSKYLLCVFSSQSYISVLYMFFDIFIIAIGNIIGGTLFVSLPLALVYSDKKN